MKTLIPRERTLAALAALVCLASCGRPAAVLPPPRAEPDHGVSFVSGFHQEEVLTPTTALRWAHQDAVLRVNAPDDGQYRVTFQPFTAFSTEEEVIEIKVNGRPAGKFSTRAFDLSDAVPTPVEVALRAGGNDLALHASRPDVHLGENDERLAAFGLLLPVTVEPAP